MRESPHKLPETAKYGYIAGLDGLRAISVAIVIMAHFGVSRLLPGGFGVTVFFFLSGFLITRLLIAEQSRHGSINFKQFFLRRVVRLYPAFTFMVFGTTFLFYLLDFGHPSSTELWAAMGYFTNVLQVILRTTGGDLPLMSWTHLWSLSVEEHFYLIFPLLVVLLRNKKDGLLWAVIAVIALVPMWRMYVMHQLPVSVEDYNYMMTDARLDSIAWGCLLSIGLNKLGSVQKLKWLIGFVPIGLACAAVLASFLVRDESFRFTWRYSVQGAALLVLVLNLYYFKSLNFAVRILEFPVLTWIGKISYPLYLWHYPVIDITHRVYGDTTLSLFIALGLSFSIAAESYYWVETPFSNLRHRLGSQPVAQRA